jgi:tetratricopeptide (TPR) repeat protein
MGGLMLWMLLAFSPVAQAQAPTSDESKARVLYTNGKMLFDEGRYQDALAAWTMAYDLSERPLLLFNIALAQEKIGALESAVETLYSYRIHAPASEQEMLVQKIADLNAQIAAAEPADPEVVPAEQPPAEESPREEPSAEEPPAEEPPPTTTREPWKLSTPTVITWSVAGASAVSGLSFGLISNKHGKTVATHCTGDGGKTQCTPGVDGPAAKQRSAALIADVSWGMSLAATGVAVWLTLRDAKPTMAPSLYWFGTGVGVRGQF